MAMNVELYATKVQFNTIAERDEHEKAYDRLPDVSPYWCIVDLVSSSNYRLIRGPRLGYIRGETFFSVIRNVITSCPEVRTIKEMGDAVLLVSSEFRSVFESLILIDRVCMQIAAVAGEDGFPFSVRGAINFGIAKRLKRMNEDYLGSPLDRLARTIGADDINTNLFIHDEAYEHASEILEEYSEFINISPPIQLQKTKSKTPSRRFIIAKSMLTKRH